MASALRMSAHLQARSHGEAVQRHSVNAWLRQVITDSAVSKRGSPGWRRKLRAYGIASIGPINTCSAAVWHQKILLRLRNRILQPVYSSAASDGGSGTGAFGEPYSRAPRQAARICWLLSVCSLCPCGWQRCSGASAFQGSQQRLTAVRVARPSIALPRASLEFLACVALPALR